jgi:hypothetical protein
MAQVTISGTPGFPNGTPLNGIAYGNSVYVAVGGSGYIITSSNGTDWTVQKTSSFINTTYTRVTFGNSMFVAVTSDGKIVTSSDGITWTQRTSGTTNFLNDVTYASSKFIAVGNNNTALTSTDGITWSSLNIGAGSSDNAMSIVYASSKFVVGVRDASGNSRSYYSTTGAAGTWSSASIEASAQSLNKIVYLNNKFFAFTALTNIYTSSDGVSWSALVNSRLTTPNQVFHGFYDGTKYYLFGNCSEFGYTAVFTSTDGTTFSLQSQKSTLVTQYSAYLNGRYFILGNEGLISSSDGANWSFPAGSYNALAFNGTRYVAVGQNTGSEASIFTSTDYNSWTSATTSIFKPLFGVTYGNSKFVAVGNVDASAFGTVATSTDGLTWAVGNSGIADNLRAVVYGNGKYVAVGLNGRIIYSTNGTSWTSAESGSGYNYYGVAYLNNYFIAVGGGTALNSSTKVKYSSDGVSWTDVSPSISGQFHSIAYGGGKYLLVGRDNTSGSQKFFSVTTSNITSSAGYSSSVTVTTPEGDVGTLGFGGVAYNNSIFTAIVNLKVSPFSAYILTSTDGASWTATAANTSGRLRGIIPSGNAFKVIGTADTRLTVNAGTTLPLQLVDFYFRKNNSGSITLSWKTLHEENVSRFEIERSEGFGAYSKIGQEMALNTAGQNSYSYIDVNPTTGTVYYRLKLVDIDGKFTYSPVLRISSLAKNTISIFPNPATEYVTVTLAHDRPGTIIISGQDGRLVLSRAILGTTQVVPVDGLPPGMYIIRVRQGEETFSEKFIKQ